MAPRCSPLFEGPTSTMLAGSKVEGRISFVESINYGESGLSQGSSGANHRAALLSCSEEGGWILVCCCLTAWRGRPPLVKLACLGVGGWRLVCYCPMSWSSSCNVGPLVPEATTQYSCLFWGLQVNAGLLQSQSLEDRKLRHKILLHDRPRSGWHVSWLHFRNKHITLLGLSELVNQYSTVTTFVCHNHSIWALHTPHTWS